MLVKVGPLVPWASVGARIVMITIRLTAIVVLEFILFP